MSRPARLWTLTTALTAAALAPPARAQPPTPKPPDLATPRSSEGGQVASPSPAALPGMAPPSGAIPPASVRPRDLSQPAPPSPVSYTITLGPRRACAQPSTGKLAVAEGGTVEVETASPDTLSALLSGTTAASAYLGCRSDASMTVDLYQEFEVAASDPSAGLVVFQLDSTLVGALRSKHKGGARVRTASATISPLGAPCAPLALSHPPQAVEGTGGRLCNLRLNTIQGPPMPVGRYVLTARFTIEADAAGLADGHSAADFAPEVSLADPFARSRDPFQGASKKEFGFDVTIKAVAPAAPEAPLAPAALPAAAEPRPPAFRSHAVSPPAPALSKKKPFTGFKS